MFHSIDDMINHKQYYCKLRFTCKCAGLSLPHKCSEENGEYTFSNNYNCVQLFVDLVVCLGYDTMNRCDLYCGSCHQQFNSSLDLVMHVQVTFSKSIFKQAAKVCKYFLGFPWDAYFWRKQQWLFSNLWDFTWTNGIPYILTLHVKNCKTL